MQSKLQFFLRGEILNSNGKEKFKMHCISPVPKEDNYFTSLGCMNGYLNQNKTDILGSRDFQVSCYINTVHKKRKRLGLVIDAKSSIKLDFFFNL